MTPSSASDQQHQQQCGIVYCCAQPSFAGAPTFEWCSLTSEASRNSCRRVVQKVFARIDTSSFGERRQYVNDAGNVQLLSIVGVDKCIFIVGCMKKDFIEDPTTGSSVAVEMDRLLVAMQRAFAQYIAKSIKNYRENFNGGNDDSNNNKKNKKRNNNNNNNNNRNDDDDEIDANNSYGIDQPSLIHFDDAVQNAIDDASNRIADVIYNAATSANNPNGGNNGGAANGDGGGGGFGEGLRRFLGRGGGAGGAGGNQNNNNNNNNKASVISNGLNQNQQQQTAANHYHHESVAASYLSGVTGADDFGAGRRASSIRRSILARQQKNDDSDDEEGDNDGHTCCTTRMKFVICFVVIFIIAVVIFILLFACERRDTDDFKLHCGHNS